MQTNTQATRSYGYMVQQIICTCLANVASNFVHFINHQKSAPVFLSNFIYFIDPCIDPLPENVANIWHLYNFDWKKVFWFGRMMMLSPSEMKSKFFQKYKAIYLWKFFKILGLVSWAIYSLSLKFWFWILCVYRRCAYKTLPRSFLLIF